MGKSLIVFAIGMTIILSSCKDNEPEAFAYGNFEAKEIMVSSEVNGTITSFPIEEGDNVKKGAVLGCIDTLTSYLRKQQIIAAMDAVSAKMVQIDRQIAVARVKLQNLDREIKRISDLKEAGAATEKQFDELSGNKNLVLAEISALESQKLSVKAEMQAKKVEKALVEDQIHRSVLMAPSNGQVLEKYLEEGELATRGRSLFLMADLSSLILRVYIDGDQLAQIKNGQKVMVNYDSDQIIKQVRGKITWISSEAEFTPKIIQTRDERVNLVYAVKVIVPNDGSLKIGMPGEISLK